MQTDYDILIIGGGMVGASLACALRGVTVRVGLVEAAPAEARPGFDARAIALSEGSRRIFATLGLWSGMDPVTPIRRIHISDRGHLGAVRIDAEEEGVEALGHVVEARIIGQALDVSLARLPDCTLISPALLTGVTFGPNHVTATLEREGRTVVATTRLVVAADGGRSTVAELVGARSLGLPYHQSAVAAAVVTDRDHEGVAYERFTETGPIALLPCRGADPEARGQGDRRWALVWTVRDKEVDEVMALDDRAFLGRLRQRLGRRPGRLLSVGARTAYPLGMGYVRGQVRPRLVFIGNAAHRLHPVAGQGFNLGLRDAATLAEVVATAVERGADPGGMDALGRYAAWRRPDHLRTIGLTDGFVRLFSNNFAPAVLARNLGMLALDLSPGLKHAFARQAMGLAGRVPRLARGLALGGGASGEE